MALGPSLHLVHPVCQSFEISPPGNLHEEKSFHCREALEHVAVIGSVTKGRETLEQERQFKIYSMTVGSS